MKKKTKSTAEGKRLSYPAGQQVKYRSKIRALVNKMTAETNRRVKALLNSSIAEQFINQQEKAAALDESLTSKAKKLMNSLTDKFTQLFSSNAKPLAENMVESQKTVSKTDLDRSLKDISGDVTIKAKLAPPGMEDVTNAIVQENISLISSIPTDYMKQIQGSLMRAIAVGGDTEMMNRALRKYDGMTDRRANNIADDQVRKTYNAVNRQRMQSSGIKKFKWLHSGGGQHPRPDHIAMSGNIYSFDDLPIIDQRTGERGIPGQAINCRCTMTPVIEFNEE